jgi:ABC-type ATPase with predicted acetyltransferase domain
MKYIINKVFKSSVKRTPRVLEVAEAFGIGLDDKEFVVYDNFEIDVEQGDVVYITGESGSGKSLLLRELAKQMADDPFNRVMDVDAITWTDAALVEQVGRDMTTANFILSKAGINDGYLLARSVDQLSDGQKYRFALAKLIDSDSNVWVADEFGAKLDRVTAKAVALNMQKAARARGVTLIVATTHTDLVEELGPDILVEKLYMDRIEITKKETE